MVNNFRDDTILEMLQKPVEIFAGIMPLKRTLFTNRTFLRRCRKIDAVELRLLMIKNRNFLSKWLQPQPEVLRLESVVKLIVEDQMLAKKGVRLDLGIFDAITTEMIGKIALHSVDYGIQRSGLVSYWLDEDKVGKGYMTEALATLVSFAFEEACLHRVNVKISADNETSLSLVKKLGFVQEGLERKSLFINGKWCDALLFGLLDDEYDSRADSWMENGWLGC